MADIHSKVTIDDGFSSPLSRLARQFTSVGDGASRLKNKLAGGMNTNGLNGFNNQLNQTKGLFGKLVGANVIGSGITKGIGAATSGISSMVGELNESSKAWQTFEGNMKMNGNSMGQINAAKKDMQQFAQDTIYSSSDMASAYAQFDAVGTKHTGKLVKGLGGLAAASSDPTQAMKTLSQQSVQAAAKPQLQWQDFRLMLEQTPAGMAQVAKTMGKSTQQLIQDVQAGTVKTQDFFDAVSKTGTNKSFSKMARSYKTVGQAMDGLRETVANKTQPAFDKLSKIGIKAVVGIGDSLDKVDFNKMADKIIPVAQSIMRTITSVGKFIGGTFSNIWAGLADSGVATSIGNMFSSIGNSINALSQKSKKRNPFQIFKDIGNGTGKLIGTVASAIGSLATTIGKMNPSIVKTLGISFLILKAGMRGIVFGAIIAGLKLLSKLSPNALKAVAISIAVLAGAFMLLKTAFNGMQMISKGMEAINKIKSGLGGLGKASTAAETTTKPVSKVGANFIKMGAGLALAGIGILAIGAGMYLMASASIKLANAGWGAIGMLVALIAIVVGTAILANIFAPALIVAGAALAVFGIGLLIVSLAILVAAAGIALLANQLPTIQQYGVGASLAILALAGVIAVFGIAAIVAAIGAIALGVGLIVLSVGMIIAAVGAGLLGAAAIILGIGLLLVGAGLYLVAGGISAVVSSIGKMIGAMANAMNGVVNAVKNGFNAVKNWVSNGIKGAVDTVTGFIGSMKDAGANLMHGLANGISGAIGAVTGKIKGVASNVVGGFKSMLGIHSPSRVFKGFGQYMDMGLAIGIDKHAKLPTQSVNDLATNVSDIGNNMQISPDVSSTAPTKSPFNDNSSNSTANYATTNNSNYSQPQSNSIDRSINISNGAIQIISSGNEQIDGNRILSEIEKILKSKKEGGIGYGYE